MVEYNSFRTSHFPRFFVINATYIWHLLKASNEIICVSFTSIPYLSSDLSPFVAFSCCISHLQFTIAMQIIHMKCINCAMQLININRRLCVCCVCVLCTSQKWMSNFLLPPELRVAFAVLHLHKYCHQPSPSPSSSSSWLNLATTRTHTPTHTHNSSVVARWRCNQLCQNANAESQKSSASSSSRGNCDSGNDNSSNNIVVGKSNLNKHKYIYIDTHTNCHTHTGTHTLTGAWNGSGDTNFKAGGRQHPRRKNWG